MKKYFFSILVTTLCFFASTQASIYPELSEEVKDAWIKCFADAFNGRELMINPIELPEFLKTPEMKLLKESEIFTFTYDIPNESNQFCDKHYKALLINTLGNIKSCTNLRMNNTGNLRGENGELPIISLCDVIDAESFVLVIVDENDSIFAAKEIIPKPIHTNSESGVKINVKTFFLNGVFYILKAQGFLPNEKLKTVSQSIYERIEGEATTSKEGNLVVQLFPQVIGFQKGKASYTIIRTEGNFKGEKLRVEYNWIDL